MTECSIEPSGVFSSGHSHHVSHMSWSFQPVRGSHVSPPSSVRNKPCGDPPAYQDPGSLVWPGVNQNTELSERFSRSPVANAGGRLASVHVSPPSFERNTVG